MSSSHKSFWNSNDARFSPNKMTMLNPNAAEFVPSALRYLPGNNKKVDVAKLEVPGTSRKAVLDQSAANVSSHSDEEAHQHWCHQLPDDITPDFKGMGEELQAPAGLSLAGFSINGATEASRFPLTMGSHPLGIHHERMPQGVEHKTLNQRIGCSGLSYSQDDPSIALMNLSATPLDKQFRKVDQHLTNDEECRYDGNLPSGFLDGFLSEHDGLEDAVVYPEEFLASRFPGFRSESLAELYYANGCNMNLTIDMLTQSSAKAHVIGNKPFANELGVNGQLYDIQMQEAQERVQERARESVLIQRNPVTQIHSYNQAQDPLIDLHGLHVNEAIHVLKHELNILRRTARSAGRRLQVMIRVSTGPHSRGFHNPVRLPIAVQQYLLDEKLQFSEDQPGLLRLVIC